MLFFFTLGPKLTPTEEDELMKKWQEILGPNNEVVVRMENIYIYVCV